MNEGYNPMAADYKYNEALKKKPESGIGTIVARCKGVGVE
jgi:hypothetical protein